MKNRAKNNLLIAKLKSTDVMTNGSASRCKKSEQYDESSGIVVWKISKWKTFTEMARPQRGRSAAALWRITVNYERERKKCHRAEYNCRMSTTVQHAQCFKIQPMYASSRCDEAKMCKSAPVRITAVRTCKPVWAKWQTRKWKGNEIMVLLNHNWP